MCTLSPTREAKRSDSLTSTIDQNAPTRITATTKSAPVISFLIPSPKEAFVFQPSRPWQDHRISTYDMPFPNDSDDTKYLLLSTKHTDSNSASQDPKSTSPLLENSEPTQLLAIGIGRGSYVGPTTWKRTGVQAETLFKTKLYKLACGGRWRDRRRHGLLAPEGEESSVEFTHAGGVHDVVLPEEIAPFAASLERRRRTRGNFVVESRSKIERSDEELGALWVWLKRRR